MNTFLAVLAGGVLAAAGGLLSGWETYRFGRKRDEITHAHEQQMAREAHAHEQQIAREALGHQQQMARDALAQERLDRAYTELGIFLSHWAAWARSVHPFMGQGAPPDPMPDEEQWRIETLVTNHGSAEVRRLLDKWGEQRMKIQEADIVITTAAQSRDPGVLGEKADQEHEALLDYRSALHEAATAIRDQMRKELAGQPQPALERGDRPAG
jgi:hypothetical protein